jgi:glycerol transport system ATP-binding protein
MAVRTQVFLLVQSLPPEAASSVRAVVELVLERISKRVGGQTWLHPMHLELESGAVTVMWSRACAPWPKGCI